jgi:hypothetical protein
MKTEFKIYKSGKSGWVENKNACSVHFIVYQKKEDRFELGWDMQPTNKMKKIAISVLKKFHKNNYVNDWHSIVNY